MQRSGEHAYGEAHALPPVLSACVLALITVALAGPITLSAAEKREVLRSGEGLEGPRQR